MRRHSLPLLDAAWLPERATQLRQPMVAVQRLQAGDHNPKHSPVVELGRQCRRCQVAEEDRPLWTKTLHQPRQALYSFRGTDIGCGTPLQYGTAQPLRVVAVVDGMLGEI